LGSRSPYLAKILKTHWLRKLLVNAYAAILLAWTDAKRGRKNRHRLHARESGRDRVTNHAEQTKNAK